MTNYLRLLTILQTAVAPLVWGTSYWVATELLPPDRPLFAAAGRALPAGVALALVTRRIPPPGWRLRRGDARRAQHRPLLRAAVHRRRARAGRRRGDRPPRSAPIVVLLLGWPVLGLRPTARRPGLRRRGVVGVGALVLDPSTSVDPIGLRRSRGRDGVDGGRHRAGPPLGPRRRCRCSRSRRGSCWSAARWSRPLALATRGRPAGAHPAQPRWASRSSAWSARRWPTRCGSEE